MPTRGQRLIKLQRMLGQIREVEEARQAQLEQVARDIDERRKLLVSAIGQFDGAGAGLSQSYLQQYIRKKDAQIEAEAKSQRQRDRVLLVARREAAAERLAAAAVGDEQAALDEETLASVLERIAAAPFSKS